MERYFNYAYDYRGDGSLAIGCTVTVYDAGTLNLASVFSDEGGTPMANPFTTDPSGFFYFYAVGGRYDVTFSGTGITIPFTWADIQLIDDFNVIFSNVPNTLLGDQIVVGDFSISGKLEVAGNEIINVAGKIPGLSSTYFSSLDGAALLNLNATQLLNGTLPSARLTGVYNGALSFTNPTNSFSGSTLALGATPATTGSLRLTYNEGIYSTDNVGVDRLLLRFGVTGNIEMSGSILAYSVKPSVGITYDLGAAAGGGYLNGYISNLYASKLAFGESGVATSGAIRLGTGTTSAISFLDAGAATKRIYVNGSSQLAIELPLLVAGDILPASASTYDLGGLSAPFVEVHAEEGFIGDITLNSSAGTGIVITNNAGSGTFNLISRNSSDVILFASSTNIVKYLYPLGNTAGSAAGAMGAMPSGATTTFKGWVKMQASDGDVIYIPAWK